MLGRPPGRIVRVGPVIRIVFEMFEDSKMVDLADRPQEAPSEWIAVLKEMMAFAARVMTSPTAHL